MLSTFCKHVGVIIYLDVYENDILNRLSAMKVNRIVGFNEGNFIYLTVILYRSTFVLKQRNQCNILHQFLYIYIFDNLVHCCTHCILLRV